MIAPSHGVVYPDPAFILSAYRDWSGPRLQNKVLVPFVSMHGSTRAMVDHLVDGLAARHVMVEPCNLTCTDLGHLAQELVDAATLVVGTPAVLGGAHPTAVAATYLAGALRPKVKQVALIGSYGWGSRLQEQLTGFFAATKPEFLEPVLIKGLPGPEAYAALDRLADTIVARHQALGLL
jgi:flavorubredoxin